MIIINKTRKNKKYQTTKIPNFKNKKSKLVWLKQQRMNVILANIKNVSIQVKDIKQMIYSSNSFLVALYTKLSLNNYNSNDDYITIPKSKYNKTLIYSLITTDWLINYDDIKNKTDEEIEQICMEIENKISKLMDNSIKEKYYCNINNKIRLLQYKLSCLTEYLSKKDNKNEIINPKVRKKYKI